jgi:hypothetical protein
VKHVLFGLVLLTSVACFSQAQNQTVRPLLGTKQRIENSAFCKQYKCQKMPETIGRGYVLELPDDWTWDDIKTDPDYKKLNLVQLWSIYRTVMFVSTNEKTGQIESIGFHLRENFRGNKGTYRPETVMIVDAIYYAMGKRLTLDKTQGESYSRDVTDCFLRTRARASENIERLTRVMMTGEVMLETEKRKAQARAVCSSRFDGSTPDRYMPTFRVELTPERG